MSQRDNGEVLRLSRPLLKVQKGDWNGSKKNLILAKAGTAASRLVRYDNMISIDEVSATYTTTQTTRFMVPRFAEITSKLQKQRYTGLHSQI